MNQKILLTSFQTWLPHQKSNASDDLLAELLKLNLSPNLIFLRQLPVDVSQAASLVISKIEELQPDAIICCGMAESRQILTVESCATSIEALNYLNFYIYCLLFSKSLNTKIFQSFLSSLSWAMEFSINTSVDLEKLVTGLSATEISYDAGKFVCEGLYFEVLKYLQDYLNIPCIFVHVPVLTAKNLAIILEDLQVIIQKI